MAKTIKRELPPEIITEILYLLSSKTLGRFKCVSNYWSSLISEPKFIKRHQQTLNQNHIIFTHSISLYSIPFNHHDSSPTKLQLEDKHREFIFLGSSNGLVLVSTYNFHADHTLVVFNPTTKEFIDLPRSDYDMVDDLEDTDIQYGFGYDSLNDDYKVVTISFYKEEPEMRSVHVYSLRDNTWNWAIDSPYDHSFGRQFPGVFVNGNLHWIAGKGFDHEPVIVAFCLADETLSEVPSPNLDNDVDILSKISNDRYDCKLVNLGEKLGIFLEMEGEIWLMNEYGVRESWTKILVHGLNDMPKVQPLILDDKNGKIMIFSGDLMLIYDVDKRCFCKSVDISRFLKEWGVCGSYVESLVSPKFITGVGPQGSQTNTE